MSKIRVGVIRCDLHAMYYGIVMYEHDPLKLHGDKIGRGHAAYYYFYTDYNDPRLLIVPKVKGFELARVWDKNRHIAENMAKLFGNNTRICDSFEEVSDDVDLVFIANCNFDGTDHLEFATPGLQKSVLTFVDKPFAYEVNDVKAMIKLARDNDTAVMSLSMLRTLPDVGLFRSRFGELGDVQFGTIRGGGAILAGQIHATSLAQHLFGPGVESVEALGEENPRHVLLDYGGKADRPEKGVVINYDAGMGFFYASAYGPNGAIHSREFNDYVFPKAAVINANLIKKMVRTRQSQAPYDEMIECVAVAEAARIANETAKRVYLKEIM